MGSVIDVFNFLFFRPVAPFTLSLRRTHSYISAIQPLI